MSDKIQNAPVGRVGLIMQTNDGTIVQLGLTEEQSSLLQILVGSLTTEKPLYRLPAKYDLALKNDAGTKSDAFVTRYSQGMIHDTDRGGMKPTMIEDKNGDWVNYKQHSLAIRQTHKNVKEVISAPAEHDCYMYDSGLAVLWNRKGFDTLIEKLMTKSNYVQFLASGRSVTQAPLGFPCITHISMTDGGCPCFSHQWIARQIALHLCLKMTPVEKKK